GRHRHRDRLRARPAAERERQQPARAGQRPGDVAPTLTQRSRHAPSSTPAASDAVWYTRCTIPTAFSIAVERGLLADELAGEIELRSLVSTPDRAFRDVHFTHDHPRFFRQGGNIPPIA